MSQNICSKSRLKPRFEFDKKDEIWRGYLPGMIVPICDYCERKPCDFGRKDLGGCSDFMREGITDAAE